MKLSGNIQKMQSQMGETVQYHLPVGEDLMDMNALLGKTVSIQHGGKIHCIHCGRETKKSFNQGYCYPCMISLAECDSCIVRPELCHLAAGTCRDAEWAAAHCLQDHFVYLANSSGVKVGITRHSQVPTRWIDQGAVEALPIFRVKDRYTSGLVEVALKRHVADKTDWRRMLKGDPEPRDLQQVAAELIKDNEKELAQIAKKQGKKSITPLSDSASTVINFPVLEYPKKVTSLNLDKLGEVSGTLQGIKGQYLIFDVGVINMRKYAGYLLSVSAKT